MSAPNNGITKNFVMEEGENDGEGECSIVSNRFSEEFMAESDEEDIQPVPFQKPPRPPPKPFVHFSFYHDQVFKFSFGRFKNNSNSKNLFKKREKKKFSLNFNSAFDSTPEFASKEFQSTSDKVQTPTKPKIIVQTPIEVKSGKMDKKKTQNLGKAFDEVEQQKQQKWLLPGEKLFFVIENCGYLRTSVETGEGMNIQANDLKEDSELGFSLVDHHFASQFENTTPGVEYRQVLLGTFYMTNYQARFVQRKDKKEEPIPENQSQSRSGSAKKFNNTVNANDKVIEDILVTQSNEIENSIEYISCTPLLNIVKVESKVPNHESNNSSSVYTNCEEYISIRCKDFHLMQILFYNFTSQRAPFAFGFLQESLQMQIKNLFAEDYGKKILNSTSNPSPSSHRKQITYLEEGMKNFSKELIEAGWRVYQVDKEFSRQTLSLESPDCKWKKCLINKTYLICDSYPKEIIVPRSMSDEKIYLCSNYRSKGRLPALTWIHPTNGYSITRCAQPLPGLSRNRSQEDEEFLQHVLKTASNSSNLFIVDARPKANAMANTVMGKGYENISNYPNCTIEFFGIENIHAMTSSLQMLSKVVNKPDSNWINVLDSSGWLKHLRGILMGAVKIADLIENKKSPVLVHCSDGWDRTSQLCAVAELLLDPYYRTIEGFQVLIEKDWVSFGFKFADRCGHFRVQDKMSEMSPIFLQFIDCTWHIFQQFPTKFEFNEIFLITILDHVNSCLFGNFLHNTEKEREDFCVKQKCISLWTYINSDLSRYTNPFYEPPIYSYTNFPKSLVPDCNISTLTINFWVGYYFRYKMGLKSQYQMLIKSRVKYLERENAVILENLQQEEKTRRQLEQELLMVKKMVIDYKKFLEQTGQPALLIDESSENDLVVVTKLDDEHISVSNKITNALSSLLKIGNSSSSNNNNNTSNSKKEDKKGFIVDNYF